MDKRKSCFFTGHRRLPSERTEEIRERLTQYIEAFINEKGIINFISGGALGFDMLAADCVAKLREKYPQIRLVLYLPCINQSNKWGNNEKYYYRLMLSRADEILYVSEEYDSGCMQRRNMRMVWDSSCCIAFCTVAKSGTGQTVRNAKAVGMEIVNIADDIYE